MDDIEMLLPGLKVSSSLIRQRPVSPESSEEEGFETGGCRTPVGGKRRHDEAWRESAEETAGSPKRAQKKSADGSALVSLRLSPSSSSSSSSCIVESMPGLHQLQAGITTAMLDELNESPKTSNPDTGFKTQEASSGGPGPLLDPRSADLLAAGMHPASAHRRGHSAEATPDSFQKTITAPCRLEQALQCSSALGLTLHNAGSPGRASALSDSLPMAGSTPQTSPASPPQPQPQGRCSLTRAEKWHERINLATLRMRQNSLPSGQMKPKVASSLTSS